MLYRHATSSVSLRCHLLLKEKAYVAGTLYLINILIRIALQCFHNLTEGEISPLAEGFHLPQGDFTPAIAGISRRPKGGFTQALGNFNR